jgi:uncharacterized membrane protein YhaH (DUF805 family)
MLPAKLTRSEFCKWLVIGIAGLMVYFIVSQGRPEYHWLSVLVLLGWMIFYLLFLVPRRLTDIGWDGWLTVLFFIPLVNLGLLVLLMTKPSKR